MPETKETDKRAPGDHQTNTESHTHTYFQYGKLVTINNVMPPPALFWAENETRTVSVHSNLHTTEDQMSPLLPGATLLQKHRSLDFVVLGTHGEDMLGKGNATRSRSTSVGGQGPGAADFLIPPRHPIRFSCVPVSVSLEEVRSAL